MPWRTKKLGEVLELCDSGTWGDELSSGMPLLRSTNMQNGELVLSDVKYINVPKEKVGRYTLCEGDILITKSSGSVDHIGKSLFITKEMDRKYGFSNFTQRLRVDKTQVLPKWVYLKISNPATRDFLLGASQTTTGLRNLKIPALKELKIPLPPLSEQKKIVAKLERVLAKISEVKKLRAEARGNADNLLPAELHAIFNSKFKNQNAKLQSKIQNWEEKEFKEVVEQKTAKNTKRDLPFVGMEDVESETGRFLGSLEPKSVKSTTFYFDKESVLYGKLRPYLNKVLLPDFEGHCSTEFILLKPKEEVSKEWIAYWLKSPQTVDGAMSTNTGSRMPRANMKDLMKFKIPLPPLAEQKKIVAYLDSLSEKIGKIKNLQSATQNDFVALEQAILSKAFTNK